MPKASARLTVLLIVLSAILSTIPLSRAQLDLQTKVDFTVSPSYVSAPYSTVLVSMQFSSKALSPEPFHGITVSIIAPGEGGKETVGPLTTDLNGTSSFEYGPRTVGTYFLSLSYPGETTPNGHYLPVSANATLIVAQSSDYNPPPTENGTVTAATVAVQPPTDVPSVVVTMQVSPPPPLGGRFIGLTVSIIVPSGSIQAKGPFDSDADGRCQFVFFPTVMGNHTFQLSYPGQGFDNRVTYLPAASPAFTADLRPFKRPTANPTPNPDVPQPVIYSVTPISAVVKQTIHITGIGFGHIQPVTMGLGDGSVNTVGGGTTPVLRIYNLSGRNTWQAGVQDNPGSGADAIGVILTSWSDTEIVLGGFGAAVNTNGEGQWNLLLGDQLLISVLTANGQAAYATTVERNGSTSSGAAPIIASVTPVSATRQQNIVIRGRGFGDIQPQFMNLSDGSVVTKVGGSTPTLRIYNIQGWRSWEAGSEDSQWVPGCLIGVYLTNWSDNEIVLGGFGADLSVDGQGRLSISPGDPLIIDVSTANGHSAYTATVIPSQPGQDMAPIPSPKPTPAPLPTPVLTVSCQSITTDSHFKTAIFGNVTLSGMGVAEIPVFLSYSVNGGNSWNDLTLVCTDVNGNFIAQWTPLVTGNFLIRATWAGNDKLSPASTTVNLAVVPSEGRNVFSVASNSTVTGLYLDSARNELSFTVSGESGTSGYVDLYVSKAVILDVSSLNVKLDGDPREYTHASQGDSWRLSFSYHHSTHQISIDLGASTAASTTSSLWIVVTLVFAIIVLAGLVLVKKRRG